MQGSVENTSNQQGKKPRTEPSNFSKLIGSTIYTVSVYHSQTSRETAEDKLLRLIENEVRNSA